MHRVVFTITCCICTFQPDRSNFIKWPLSCTLLLGMIKALQLSFNLSMLQIKSRIIYILKNRIPGCWLLKDTRFSCLKSNFYLLEVSCVVKMWSFLFQYYQNYIDGYERSIWNKTVRKWNQQFGYSYWP